MAFDLDKKYVDAAEEKLGARLPPTYRGLMLRLNGGAILIEGETWQLHPIFDSSDRKRISRTCNDVVRETAYVSDWPGWPAGALAIGRNGCGDVLLFLRADGHFEPQVYCWRHETGELSLVADDFAELKRGP